MTERLIVMAGSRPGRTAPCPARGWRMWRREMLSTVPNQLTTLRLVLLLPLWLLALLQLPVAVGILLAVAAATDVLDGYLARSRRQVSEFGCRFDSVADHLLTTSTVLWLLLLRPEFFREQYILLLGWAATAAAALLVVWVRFRQVGGLHLYSAKTAAFVGYCFAVYLLIFGAYPNWLFHAVLGICLVAAVETIIAGVVLREADERVGTVLRRRGRVGR